MKIIQEKKEIGEAPASAPVRGNKTSSIHRITSSIYNRIEILNMKKVKMSLTFQIFQFSSAVFDGRVLPIQDVTQSFEHKFRVEDWGVGYRSVGQNSAKVFGRFCRRFVHSGQLVTVSIDVQRRRSGQVGHSDGAALSFRRTECVN
uniref:Uncharacterized protein n=1 Tax=Romanomermis culicivorax TaxID=13658 RepID=A0A915JN83_ROMCU